MRDRVRGAAARSEVVVRFQLVAIQAAADPGGVLRWIACICQSVLEVETSAKSG
jgi:hypothetical protein